MKRLKQLLFSGFLFYTFNLCLWGARFDFPVGTSGRQESEELQEPYLAYMGNKAYEHIIIPDTDCNLYFPIDGSQPDTAEVGEWSGARHIGQQNDNEVTDWWIRVFGGDRAVELSYGHSIAGVDNAIFMRFNAVGNLSHTIRVNNTGAPLNFEQHFWQTFRIIAANPVGRVLLYRLLIEIRRKDNHGNSCCEEDTFVSQKEQESFYRKNALSLTVVNSIEGCSFVLPTTKESAKIKFDLAEKQTQVVNFYTEFLEEKLELRSLDIGLFHEMLHWFHFLRDPIRFTNYDVKKSKGCFRYPLCCYYGNLSELKIWQGGCNADSEEIATVLGVPNPYDEKMFDTMFSDSFLSKTFWQPFPERRIEIKNNFFLAKHNTFLQGDDLSENVYRKSKNCNLRFSHSSESFLHVYYGNKEKMPYRFKLAEEMANYVLTLIKNNQV